MDLEITSPSNSRLKQLVTLRRRRVREQLGMTLVEGYEELVLALDAGVRPQALYLCPGFGRDDQEIVERAAAAGAEVVRLSRAAFEKVAYRESPDGWLAAIPTVPDDLASLRVASNPLMVVCEAVEKPGNLGAILRTADAAGVAAVLAADPVTDWGNPNLVRASKGTIFSVPVASGTTDEVLRWLDEHAVRLVATTPDTDTVLTDVDLTGPVAIAVGSEMDGHSAGFLAAAHAQVKIPMFGRINSLNVATAAAIAVYEAVRQRSTAAAVR